LALGVTTALGAVWYIILIAGIVYTIALVLWNALCCWPCSMRPWACCGLLQWHMIATVWLLQILAVLAFFSLGSAYVGASYATLLSILFGLLGGARCTIPNPYAPTTWPPACCPGSLCP
jgi:hypothetical protein